MEFRTPPRNEEVASFAMRLPPPLRARGNLNYIQFITLVRHLWEDGHPDIPMRPVQSSKYAKYPVIVYGLQNRTPFQTEAKKKFREIQHREEDNLITHAQRFNNIIIFTVITENNPEMCEAVIETFEDFMHECTGFFKELGVSDMFYVRRLPDRDQTRSDEDVDERAVAYNVILEKLYVQPVDKIKEIVIKSRVWLDQYWQVGVEFWIFRNLDDEFVFYAPNHVFKFGDIIKLLPPSSNQDNYAEGESSTIINHDTPDGLSINCAYQIVNVELDYITIKNLNGSDVNIFSSGMGILSGVENIYTIPAEIEDNFQSATPSH